MRKLFAITLALAMVLAVAGCGGASSSAAPVSAAPSAAAPASSATEPVAPAKVFSAGMVTDIGGVNDQSFNQSAWEGLQKAEKDFGIKVGYIESKQEADYGPNLDRMVDEDYDLIWGVGYALADGLLAAAKTNPDRQYALVDEVRDAPNLVNVTFRAPEPSFLVGYIAGMMTKTDHVGFLGGMMGEVIGQFEYGYRAGVALAADELGKPIQVDVQYAESFSDSAKGKSIAQKMYSDGADIVFQAAGGAGLGLFEAAKEANKFAIGVDSDQNHLAPDNIITSAMKRVGGAMTDVTGRIKNGEKLGGQTLSYGCKEGTLGLAPSSDKLVPAEILKKAHEVEAKIIDGSIVAPGDEATFTAYVESLKK